jgi:hypothetical protein
MHLVRMVYVSRPVKEPSSNVLESILGTASIENARHDLTGLLVFDDKHYLQVIEGGRTAVSQLLGNLYKDPRHKDLVVLEFDYIHQRQFPQWTMQFIPVAEVTREVLLRYGVSSTFDPYSFTKGSALGFMLEMAARQQARAR